MPATTLLPASVGDTRDAAIAMLRPGIAFYCGFFPRYNRMMAAHGFVTEASAIAAAWARGDRETAERAVSDAMIDATSVSGTPDQCRARIEAYRQSGIDVPIISPFARGPDASARFAAAIHACAPTAQENVQLRPAETGYVCPMAEQALHVPELSCGLGLAESVDNVATKEVHVHLEAEPRFRGHLQPAMAVVERRGNEVIVVRQTPRDVSSR
jgi:Luciferase-like monooxygenase